MASQSLFDRNAKDLDGKVAVVTGGSRGIGREIALHLAARGAKVIVNYQANKQAAQEVEEAARKAGSTVHAVQADLSKPQDVKRLFDETEEKFEKLSILINNAGFMDSTYAKVADISDEAIDKTFDLNIKGAFLALREASKRMEDGGRIVNITTSLVANTNPGYGVAAYAGSKAALETFTKCLAPELRGRKITVNAVAPGPTGTELFYSGKSEAQARLSFLHCIVFYLFKPPFSCFTLQNLICSCSTLLCLLASLFYQGADAAVSRRVIFRVLSSTSAAKELAA